MQYLDENKLIKWHSYELSEGRPLRVVMRGIAKFLTEEEVLEDLKQQGFNSLACKRITKGPERRQMPLFCVKLQLEKDASNIYSFKYICSLCITVEAKNLTKRSEHSITVANSTDMDNDCARAKKPE